MQHNFDITNNGKIVDALIKGDEATFAMVYKSYFISLRQLCHLHPLGSRSCL